MVNRRAGENPSRSVARPRRCAVFLDRDGVLNASEVRNGKPYAPTCLADFHILPEAEEALRRIKERGFVLIVVTNQPDIGNGKIDAGVVEAMHEHLRKILPIDSIRVCPHKQTEGCECRKPKPGMLVAAAEEFGLDLASTYMVGDRWSDVAAGRAVGCRTVFIDRQYGEQPPDAPDKVVESLDEAVNFIIDDSSRRGSGV